VDGAFAFCPQWLPAPSASAAWAGVAFAGLLALDTCLTAPPPPPPHHTRHTHTTTLHCPPSSLTLPRCCHTTACHLHTLATLPSPYTPLDSLVVHLYTFFVGPVVVPAHTHFLLVFTDYSCMGSVLYHMVYAKGLFFTLYFYAHFAWEHWDPPCYWHAALPFQVLTFAHTPTLPSQVIVSLDTLAFPHLPSPFTHSSRLKFDALACLSTTNIAACHRVPLAPRPCSMPSRQFPPAPGFCAPWQQTSFFCTLGFSGVLHTHYLQVFKTPAPICRFPTWDYRLVLPISTFPIGLPTTFRCYRTFYCWAVVY